MQPTFKAHQRLAQALQVALAIIIVEKAWQPVVAPLHHVLGNAGEIGTWEACHAASVAAPGMRHDQRNPQLKTRQSAGRGSEIVPDTLFKTIF